MTLRGTLWKLMTLWCRHRKEIADRENGVPVFRCTACLATRRHPLYSPDPPRFRRRLERIERPPEIRPESGLERAAREETARLDEIEVAYSDLVRRGDGRRY